MATNHTNQDELAKAIAEHLAEILKQDEHNNCPLRRSLSPEEIAGLKDFVGTVNRAKSVALGLFVTAIVGGALSMLWHGFKASLAAGKP